MRPMNVLAWAAATGAVAVVACSSVSPTQACADLGSAVCSKVSECAPTIFTEVYGDVATCSARSASSCEKALALPDTADTPDFAENCSKAYDSLSCGGALQNTPPVDCTRTQHGTIGDGSPCGAAGECASGVCQIDGTTGCGVCIEPAASGQPCKSTSDCQAGLVCALKAAPPNATAACIAPVGNGAACSNAAPIVPCQSGLICGKNNTCIAPLAAGSACDPAASECDALNGYWCTFMGTRCVAVKYATTGQTCGYDSTTGDLTVCSGGGAAPGLLGACMNITNGQGTCAAAAADGASCDAAAGPYCTPPALCLSGTCTVVDPSTCH
jgi:hypothetical protein